MNPSETLAPPVLPSPPGWWPPAPGWWLLLLVTLLAGYGCWCWRRSRAAPAVVTADTEDPLRRAALEELARLELPDPAAPASQWLQQLNALLKRLCRTRYPQDHPHTLSGRSWLAFLDSRCPAAGLSRWMILVDGAYRAECRLDARTLEGIRSAVEIWIRRHA